MQIDLRLNNVLISPINPVVIAVGTNFGIFEYFGSMTATLPNGGDPPILWEQIGGTPVVFTSPIDGLHITFTTSDLEAKTFKVCTNPGTSSEYCATAEFVHFPVDVLPTQTFNEIHSINVPVSVELAAINSRPINGMIRNNHLDPQESGLANIPTYTNFGSSDDFTEFYVSDKNLKEDIIKSTRLYEFVASAWVLRNSYPGFIRGLRCVNYTGGAVKVEIDIEDMGYANTLTRNISYTAPLKGYSERLPSNYNNRTTTSISGYSVQLSTVTVIPITDYPVPQAHDIHSISAYTVNLQSVVAMNTQESFKAPTTNVVASTTNYDKLLQTSTGVI